jgi:hypothetical protein
LVHLAELCHFGHSAVSIFSGDRCKDDRRGRLPNICITRSATPCPSPSPISLCFTYPATTRLHHRFSSSLPRNPAQGRRR